MIKDETKLELSIVVPVYNVEEYLMPCLESIDLSIRSINAEVLLIDDGSTDSSSEMAKDYADSHEKFSYYLKENGGLSDARNFGAKRASGEFLCFVDSDDMVQSNMYENMLDAARRNDAELTIVNVARFDSEKVWGSSLHRRVFNNLEGRTVHISTCDRLIYDTTAWNKLIKKEFWDRNGFQYPVGWRFEDMPVSLEMHCKANRVAYVTEIGYMWRVRDGRTASITQENNSVVNLTHRLVMLEDMFDYIDREQNGDGRLRDLLEKKIINLDLPLYIDMIPYLKDEKLKEDYLSLICEFYNKYLKKQNLSEFSAIIEEKTKSTLKGNIDHLKKLMEYQNTDYWNCPVSDTEDGPCLVLPEEIFENKYRKVQPDMTFAIPNHSLTSCELGDGSIELSFYCYFRRLNVMDPEEFKVKAFLVNAISGDKHELEIEREYDPAPDAIDGTVYEIMAGTEEQYSYEHNGFRFTFDLNSIENTERFLGNNYVLIRYDSIAKEDSFIFNFKDEVIKKVFEKHVMLSERFRSMVRTDANDNLIIEISERDKEIDGQADIFDSDWKGFVVKDLNVDGSLVRVTLDHSNLKKIDYNNVQLNYYDPLAEKKVQLTADKTDNNTFIIDFDDPCLEKNLYYAEHEINAVVSDGNRVEVQPVLIAAKHNKVITTDKLTIGMYANDMKRLSLLARDRFPETKNTWVNTRINVYPKLRKLPIDERCILFEAYWGNQYSCNPRALYEYIDSHHPEYKCVWSLTDKRIPINGKGIRVEKFSEDYYKYLATTKYLVNNVNFENEYKKREGQIEIQTMHGTPYKTLGLDVKSDFKSERAKYNYIVRNRRWNYMIVQGKFSESMAWRWFRYKGNMLKTGYPRTDQLFGISEETKAGIKQKYGVPEGKKVILYAPTFRKQGVYEMPLDLEYMKDHLEDEFVLLIRLHHFAAKSYTVPEDSRFIFDAGKYSSIDDLYKIADVLITDYSSVMFDFALTGKPMIFFTYDLEEYTNNIRGSYFDIEKEAPGPVVRTTEDVVEALLNSGDDYKGRRKAFFKKYLTYEQPYSCEKIFEEVFSKQRNKMSLIIKKKAKGILKTILPKKAFAKARKKHIRRKI